MLQLWISFWKGGMITFAETNHVQYVGMNRQANHGGGGELSLCDSRD